jgi:NhaP-type Na+/H+ or K+/H+ antiporter
MFTLCLGGPIVGLIFGIVFYFWLKKTPKIDKLVVSITFINAFLLFFVCEYYSWNISGILAVVFSSLILSYKAKLLIIEENVLEGLEIVWGFVHFCLESILFILTGIIMGKEIISMMVKLETWKLLRESLLIVLFFIFMNVA